MILVVLVVIIVIILDSAWPFGLGFPACRSAVSFVTPSFGRRPCALHRRAPGFEARMQNDTDRGILESMDSGSPLRFEPYVCVVFAAPETWFLLRNLDQVAVVKKPPYLEYIPVNDSFN